MFIRYKPFEKAYNNTKKKLIKQLINFLFFRLYPKSISFFINLLPTFSKRIVFVRANCDHFGSWFHVFMSYAYLTTIKEEFTLFLCAKKGTIAPQWMNYINQMPIKIIYSKWLQLIFSPMFHSKYALDVNGHLVLANNSLPFREIPRLPVLNENKIKIFSEILINDLFKKDSIKPHSLLKNPYILFYARSGEWQYSIKKSRRNMPEKLGELILKTILNLGYYVVLIGDTNDTYLLDKSKVYSINDLGIDKICSIYSNANAVIGSASGAIHFPSFLFNLPSLMFTSMPLSHLDALYMPPTISNPLTETIPIKDKWIIASNLESNDLRNDIPKLINYFLSKKNLKNQESELNNPFKYIYTNLNSNNNRFLSLADDPNIVFY